MSRWSLWSLRPVLVGYVLAIDLAAIAVIVAAGVLVPVRTIDVLRFALLAVGSAVHIEATRQLERLREYKSEGVPYVSLNSVWCFGAALALPLQLALAVVLLSYIHSWLRDRAPVHRWTFSAASVVLAAAAVAGILAALSPSTYPGLPAGPGGLLIGLGAAAAYWFVNGSLIFAAIVLSNPEAPRRQAFGRRAEHTVVAGNLALGFALATLLLHDPWVVPVLLLTVLGLHRALLLGQYQTAANTDSKTGLLTARYWRTRAGEELARAAGTATPLGVLMIDLDDFKSVNDTYGHLNGDRVLKVVAEAIEEEVREYDLVGRFGGEEFVILLPGVDAVETGFAAERIRCRIAKLDIDFGDMGHLTPEQLTCSIGGAVYPQAATTLEGVLLAADTATYVAKDQGRNRVRMLSPTADP